METIHITANTNDTTHIKAIKSLFNALKVEFTIKKEKKNYYNEDFVKKIQKGDEDLKNGRGRTVTLGELENLWK